MSKDLLDTLKIALRDDSARCRLAAAESIARAFASDPAVADYLATIAAKSPDTCVRAASLHALSKGWPRNDALAILSQVARDSTDMDLALTGIAVRVARRNHDADDTQRIWSMFCHGSVSYEMRDFCRTVLGDGWKSDGEVKKWAMNALRKQYAARFEEEQMVTFLAQAWPSDQDVATCIADWFGNHPTSFMIHDHEKWRRLFEGFRGNADLSSALRRSLSDREERYPTHIWDPDTKWVYCIIGDDNAKADVLKAYDTVNDEISKVWVLSTLMEAWPEDSDVKKLLKQEYGRSPGEVAFLSPWISSLEPNSNKRRTWLLEALRQSSKRIVSTPVRRLLEEFQDQECVDTAMRVLEQDIWYYHKVEIKNLMIAKSPHLPQAREWAESAFEEIDGPSLSAVASGYQNDPDIRQRLLKAARPAKGIVRAEVFRVLREHSIPKDSVIRVTEEIWAEEKGEIRSAGVVARCNEAAQEPELRAPLVEKLRGEITSVGLHYEMRRRAAFAGLLQLGEYDICIEAAEEKAMPRLHWLASYHDNDFVVTRALFEHWRQLSESLRVQSKKFEIPWGSLITTGSVREALSDEVLRTELIDALRTMKPQDRSPESLAVTAELLPGSPDLRAHLIETFHGYSRHDTMLAAQRIFAQHFGRNPQALSELLEGTAQKPASQPSVPPDMVYPVALGWPDSPLLRLYLDEQETPRGLPLVALLTLSGISGNTRHALACIDRFVQVTKENSWTLPDVYSQSVRDWARAPSAEPLLRRLIEDSDTSRKITAIALLASAGKLTSEERVGLLQELDELLADTAKSCPDGVDLVSGRVMTLPQAIFRYLLPGFDTQLHSR